MSRHRDVRNLNIHDEMDDDALSDGGEPEMTPEEQARMDASFDAVRTILGTEEISGIADNMIRDGLWEFFFDVDSTLEWIFAEQEKKQAAAERKENSFSPIHEEEIHTPPVHMTMERPRIPLIHLAQQQHVLSVQRALRAAAGEDDDDYQDDDEFMDEEGMLPPPDNQMRRTLSKISERTEKSEPSAHWPSKHQYLGVHGPQLSSSSPATSYGKALTGSVLSDDPVDPNTIPVSPSHSAAMIMSYYEAPPSPLSSGGHTIKPSSPKAHSVSVPPVDMIPDIPDDQSKSSHPPPPVPPKQSKLSRLASSRASSAKSGSSARSSVETVKAYPNLRQPSQSSSPRSVIDGPSVMIYPSTRQPSQSASTPSPAEGPSVMVYPNPSAASQSARPVSSAMQSSTSSHVRKAIQAAIDQEVQDYVKSPKSTTTVPPPPPPKDAKDASPTPPVRSTRTPSGSETGQKLSKLALLAQAKANSRASSLATPNSVSTTTALTPRSKAALQKLKDTPLSGHVPTLPEEHTEYLQPIGNGPSVTTAITTSYRSLYTYTDPSLSPMNPDQYVVPLHELPSPDAKRSKLAMKIKKAAQGKNGMHQAPEHSEPAEEQILPPPVPPIFQAKSSPTRASPSTFASLLTNPTLIQYEHADEEAAAKATDHDMFRRRKTTKVHDPENPAAKRPSNFHHRHAAPQPPAADVSRAFDFASPSPDDVVFNARRGTNLAKNRDAAPRKPGSVASTATVRSTSAAKEREKALKKAASTPISSRAGSPGPPTTSKSKKGANNNNNNKKANGSSTPLRMSTTTTKIDQRLMDLSGLNLVEREQEPLADEPPPQVNYSRDKLLEEAMKEIEKQEKGGKKGVSLVVIGHVDAGKSTLMGRLLYECGRLDEKTKIANERGSSKAGKSSFSWAWGLDGTNEERERGITMDIAMQSLTTPHRQITVLDAPGHKDFIPNMISGAAQADCALLVVDAATGEFEAGFERGGQTREHLLLVRSLGVSQVIVAVNKLDQVGWDKDRYDDICGQLEPFLLQSGFQSNKTKFVPVAAMLGVNLATCTEPDATPLLQWYKGPTLVDLLDKLDSPTRDVKGPLRIPVSNVFKGSGSGTSVSGRICGGVVQVGEKLRILPGDETAVVRLIQVEEDTVPWAASGSNVMLQLTGIDPVYLQIGNVMCLPTELVPLATVFTARIIVFDVQVPITSGASVELFHHSRDVPATISKLLTTLDRASGAVIKKNPRVLTKGTSAEVQISLRTGRFSASAVARPIPLEPFSANKAMGRILVRRNGETIGAGIVLEIFS